MNKDQRGNSLPKKVESTLRKILAGQNAVHIALADQIPFAKVVGRCRCGCASVELEVDRNKIGPAPAHDVPVVDVMYKPPLENVGILLFTHEGYLAYLEIHSPDDEPIREWPDIRLL